MFRNGLHDILSLFPHHLHSRHWPSLVSSWGLHSFPASWARRTLRPIYIRHDFPRRHYHPLHSHRDRRRPTSTLYSRHSFEIIYLFLGGITASLICLAKRYVTSLDDNIIRGGPRLRPTFGDSCMRLSWSHFKKHHVTDQKLLEQEFDEERKRLSEFGKWRLEKIDPKTTPPRSRHWA